MGPWVPLPIQKKQALLPVFLVTHAYCIIFDWPSREQYVTIKKGSQVLTENVNLLLLTSANQRHAGTFNSA